MRGGILPFRSGALARKSRESERPGDNTLAGLCPSSLAFLHPGSEVPQARLVLLNEAKTEKRLVGTGPL